jgi:AraC family transcriptional regulator
MIFAGTGRGLKADRATMRQAETEGSVLIRPLELIDQFPGEPFASSERMQWEGIQALRYRDQPPNEAFQPPLSYHSLVHFIHTPDEFELHSDGVDRIVPPRAGSVVVVPAGSPAVWRWSSRSDSLHVFLDAALVEEVDAETFELDPARVPILPLDGVELPELRSAMPAVNDELSADAAGGPLAAESLAHLLAVHLIRNASSPRVAPRRADGALPQRKLRAVVEYIEENLDAGLTLDQIAAVAHLSPCHFSQQFKAATGLPPHQYVVVRRVERARQFLQQDDDLSLAAIAARCGFCDQSQLSNHFKRVVGVTPRRFRQSARTA